MQTHYHITSTGLKHAISSSCSDMVSRDDSFQQILIYLLKQNIYGPVLFSDILEYFNDDKALAFKKISKMISLQLIDMRDSGVTETFEIKIDIDFYLYTQSRSDDYVLSDLDGFPVSFCGFNQQQATNISAVACDYVKAAKRSRYKPETNLLQTPLSIKTTWSDLEIIIYLLHFENLSCLLITKHANFLDKIEFLNLASYLFNRYNYE